MNGREQVHRIRPPAAPHLGQRWRRERFLFLASTFFPRCYAMEIASFSSRVCDGLPLTAANGRPRGSI